jgi:hypothetical protein
MPFTNNRFLRFSQALSVCLLYYLAIGFILKTSYSSDSLPALAPLPNTAPISNSIPLPTPRVSTPTYTGKNHQKLQAAQNVFESGFLNDHIKKADRVSVEGGFSLPIIQQPEGKDFFVSTKNDLITQFSSPAQSGVTGLLAHNYLSGQEFYKLKIGQKLTVDYDGGFAHRYKIVSITRFQKLDPSTVYSELIDLETNMEMSSTDVYNRFYSGSPHVTFQTCLEKDGHWDWGLIFITAEPIYP